MAECTGIFCYCYLTMKGRMYLYDELLLCRGRMYFYELLLGYRDECTFLTATWLGLDELLQTSTWPGHVSVAGHSELFPGQERMYRYSLNCFLARAECTL